MLFGQSNSSCSRAVSKAANSSRFVCSLACCVWFRFDSTVSRPFHGPGKTRTSYARERFPSSCWQDASDGCFIVFGFVPTERASFLFFFSFSVSLFLVRRVVVVCGAFFLGIFFVSFVLHPTGSRVLRFYPRFLSFRSHLDGMCAFLLFHGGGGGVVVRRSTCVFKNVGMDRKDPGVEGHPPRSRPRFHRSPVPGSKRDPPRVREGGGKEKGDPWCER